MRSYLPGRHFRPGFQLVFNIGLAMCLSSFALGGNRFARIDVDGVTLGGEIGRRIELTMNESLMKLDLEKDFLQPFRDKKGIAQSTHQQRYVGLGKLIDATVNFAAYTQSPKVIALKDLMIGELIDTQLPDGYLGIFEEKHRVATYWDLHEMVYYRSNDGGFSVNLYTPSKATIALGDDLKINVRQETDYPASGKVTLNLDPSRPVEFPLYLRIPAWCKNARVSVNGRNVKQPIRSGTFLAIARKWQPGDRVELNLPMTWRFVRGRKAQQGRVAVLRGPVLYCLNAKRLGSH